MPREDDISGLLPRPPMPAPARRDAAISEALRRFDGGPAAAAPEAAPPSNPPPWWTRINRPAAGALAAAGVAALIALPFALSTMPDQVPQDAPAATAPPPLETADASPGGVTSQPPPSSPIGDARRAPSFPASDGAPAPQAPAVREAPSDPAPAPRAPAGETQAAQSTPVAMADGRDAGEQAITVSGTRIRRQDLTSMSPLTVVGEEAVSDQESAIIVTGVATPRGDWNACTVQDPSRDLAACRALIDPAARGRSGGARGHLAEGLAQAWRGEHAAAISAFSRAIAVEPRSALAYLNRALSWQVEGQLDRALADLDRAVRYAPRSARGYYHRALLLQQRGDRRRACADRDRAVRLDPRYAGPLRSGALSACPPQD